MKAEAMSAAISQESPVSPGFQLKEDDVQKIEGVMTGGAQSLMKIAPQVENAVRSFKLFTNQMFSGLQKFYRAAPQPQASMGAIESADAGVMPDTENPSQEFSVQPAAQSGHHRAAAGVFTNVAQQIGELIKQPPAVLAQQLGLNSNAISEIQQGIGSFGADPALGMSRSKLVVDTVNPPNILTQQQLKRCPVQHHLRYMINSRLRKVRCQAWLV